MTEAAKRFQDGHGNQHLRPEEWKLKRGEFMQRAGPKPEDEVPGGILAISEAASGSMWLMLQRVSVAQMTAIRDRRNGRIVKGRPLYWASRAGFKVVFVWPAPNRRYLAMWLP